MRFLVDVERKLVMENENGYDDSGRAVAWKPNRPGLPLSIKCTTHRPLALGESFEVAIWPAKNKKSDRHPDYTGQVQDRWKPRENYNSNAPRDAEFDDTIPF